jgi:hypothetical protein
MGNQGGDLNVSPVADKKYNADMVGVAQTGRTMQAGGRGTGVEISTPSAVYNEDNADMGGVAQTWRTMQERGRDIGVEISTPSAVYKEDKAGMG